MDTMLHWFYCVDCDRSFGTTDRGARLCDDCRAHYAATGFVPTPDRPTTRLVWDAASECFRETVRSGQCPAS